MRYKNKTKIFSCIGEKGEDISVMSNLKDFQDRPRDIVCEVFDDFVELYIGDNAQETKIYLTLKEFDKLTKQVFMAKDDIENY